MSEIIFNVKESSGGGLEAQALGESIFVEGDTLEILKENIRDAIKVHFEINAPSVVRLHYLKEETLTA